MLKNPHAIKNKSYKIWVADFLSSTAKQKAHCLLVTWTKTYWSKLYSNENLTRSNKLKIYINTNKSHYKVYTF